MFRRTFTGVLAGALGLTTVGTPVTRSLTRTASAVSGGQIPALLFDSASALLNDQRGELIDDSVVAVRAESTATNEDSDGNGDAVPYAEDVAIPFVAVDRTVVGFGGVLVTDETNWQYGNEQFLLNVWDDALGGSGTVYWDEGHGQYYGLSTCSAFESYAESNGYDVRSTTTLSADLANADAAVITSPSTAFTSSERSALDDFVANGGWLFVHSQSDYNDYDETGNLNDLAGALGLAFRFDDGQVVDDIVNAGARYQPTTDRFDETFPYFDARDGLGLDRDRTYEVTVTSVTDGDTVDVEFADGRTEEIRVLGIDTPETSANSQYERIQEWEGIEDIAHLQNWASTATQFASDELAGKSVDLSFDPESAVRDEFGRVLGYLHYDATNDGARDDFYNRRLAENGYARVYDGSTTKHDAIRAAESAARSSDLGLWAGSDPSSTGAIRNRAVESLFFPKAATVRTDSGSIDPARVPVTAATSASQDVDGGVSDGGDLPLVGVDEAANVAVVGAPIFDEAYESGEGFAVDTSDFENFTFLTNLIDYLASTDGSVLIEGGHGQFPVSFGLTAEDAAYYLRYLEGQGIALEGVNDVTGGALDQARALVVTSSPEAFSTAEVDAIETFLADGGALVLVGTGVVTPEARANLNDLASGVGTDLRVNEDQVRDGQRNVNGDETIPTTTAFDATFPLFDAYGASGGGGQESGELAVADRHFDAQGGDNGNLNDEYVVFENVGSAALDLAGWTVEDEAGHTYQIPSGVTLDAGATLTLYTGSGTNSATDLYWNAGTAIWNNGGDTVFVFDDCEAQVLPSGNQNGGGDQGGFGVTSVHADAQGADYDNPNDEYVVFENTGSSAVDVSGWTVSDEADHTYQFPSGTSIDPGATLTLHSGSGTDSASDCYWGYDSSLWNNGGDTVFVSDESGTQVVAHSY